MKKIKGEKRKIRISGIIISVLLLAVTSAMIAGALIVPGRILNSQAYAREGIVTPVPTDYYSGPSEAIEKNAEHEMLVHRGTECPVQHRIDYMN